MPIANQYDNTDPDIPSIFIKQALMEPKPEWALFGRWRLADLEQATIASEKLVEEFGEKFYQDLGTPGKTTFPYIRWKIEDVAGMGIRHDIPRSYVGKLVVNATIVIVRNFPSGAASYRPSTPAFNNMLKCLTGVGYTPVKNEDGDTIGHITQSKWLENVRIAYTDEVTKDTITELGFKAEITYN